jgi:hypothetical protein
VQRCVQRLRPLDDVGFARIAARCPDLASSLAASEFARWLPRGWDEPRNDLSAAGLLEMTQLLQQWPSLPQPAPVATPAQLKAVSAELGMSGPQNNSLWKRFRSWLRSLFERQTPDAPASQGFNDWLRDHGFSDDLWSIVQWLALSVLGVLVGRILWVELRAGRQRRRRQQARLQDGPVAPGGLVSLSEIGAAPLHRQPGLLLALLCELLLRARLLPRSTALTAREVALTAPLPEERDRAQLAELAAAAEPARYAAQTPPESVLRRAVAAGCALAVGLQDGARW